MSISGTVMWPVPNTTAVVVVVEGKAPPMLAAAAMATIAARFNVNSITAHQSALMYLRVSRHRSETPLWWSYAVKAKRSPLSDVDPSMPGGL